MLRIGEFSVLSDVNIRTLRFYDEQGIFSPVYVNPENGYRFYDEKQLPVIARIQALKNMGVSLNDIKLILTNCQNNVDYQQLLFSLYKEKELEINKLQNQLTLIDRSIKESNMNCDYNYGIVLKKLPERTVAFVRAQIKDYSEQGKLWAQIDNEIKNQKIELAKPNYNIAYYYNIDKMIDIEVQRTVIKSGSKNQKIDFKKVDETLCATITFKGEYEKVPEVGIAIANWLTVSNYELDGTIFHIYHNSPNNEDALDERVTEICYPLMEW